MRLGFTPEQEAFRREAADWLNAQMCGDFAMLKGLRSQSALADERRAWERRLARDGWSVIGWPREHGGRGASLAEQVIFAEEYARAGAPGRMSHIGIELAGPTLIHFGSAAQKARFLPRIVSGVEYWAQGYSEPGAGSDLDNVRTRAWLEGDEWVIEGQKTWTSLAQFADWIFVLVRTEAGSRGPKGLSFLLVPLRQPGISLRPIRQMNGAAEFNETFFDGARTHRDNVVGGVGNGWKVAIGLLGFERGVGTLGQQMSFVAEYEAVVAAAKANGAITDPLIRDRLARAYAGLKIMRHAALRSLSAEGGRGLAGEALTHKIYWATWHRALGELAMDVLGQAGEVADLGSEGVPPLADLFLSSRADTIYGGTNQIQRNLIAEHGLGLPREPRGEVR
ncbi:alkylation response protein AidB-like acyl-CoA dehydrogenase [Sphingomonas zeicaulis]|uniref:acyl-CoA dehydrogenase family protein n=1 Tax=Sphingomonas zeicaulis TaxID=1632740 RepID=UPI003D1D28D3